MTNINKAVAKVAKKNPEFRRALVAELKQAKEDEMAPSTRRKWGPKEKRRGGDTFNGVKVPEDYYVLWQPPPGLHGRPADYKRKKNEKGNYKLIWHPAKGRGATVIGESVDVAGMTRELKKKGKKAAELKQAGSAQVEVDHRTLLRGINRVLQEYDEYGADPMPHAVAAEVINALYGPWDERVLTKNVERGSFKDMYAVAIKLVTKELADMGPRWASKKEANASAPIVRVLQTAWERGAKDGDGSNMGDGWDAVKRIDRLSNELMSRSPGRYPPQTVDALSRSLVELLYSAGFNSKSF